MSSWEPVPSLNGKYELNNSGKLRNAKTKRKLKLTPSRTYQPVSATGKQINISPATLLWEVFGIMPKKGLARKVPVVVSNGYARRHFDTATDAAKFLAPRVSMSFRTIQSYISERKKYIGGYHITYMNEPMPSSGLPKCRKK